MKMSALFACTRCAKRLPFEELSDAEQLCKECRNNFPTVKCTYCRSEFQQNDKNGVNSICRKCAHNVKAYGKPRACEYCNIIAAFIGKRCQRCSNSEKKWGPAKICEQCKQQCAFDRGTDTMRRVDGKLLCWLCTMSYKRVLVKTMKAKEFTNSMTYQGKSGASFSRAAEDPYSPGSGYPTGDDTTQDSSTPYSPGGGIGGPLLIDDGDRSSAANTPSGKSDHNMTPGSSNHTPSWVKEAKDFPRSASTLGFKHKLANEDDNKPQDLKRLKLEKNGASIVKSTSMTDFGNTEQMIAMQQLKEKVESLKKAQSIKDVQILEKDKKITELKASNFDEGKKWRERLEQIQKGHTQALANLQTKNRELQQQLKALGKAGKKS